MGPLFPTLFEEIDNNLASYGIEDYTVRVSTLEEVFIEIGRRENLKEDEEIQNFLKQAEVIVGAPPL